MKLICNLLSAGVLLAIACGGPELERTARDPAGPGEVATTVESALGEPGCTGVRADATIQGFGDAETGTAYGQGNCSRTFVVDIESYAPADAGGTLAAYSGPNPADAETCTSTRLEVFVWRRNRQTGAYEALTTRDGRASAGANGRVYVSALEEQLCQRPRVALDEQFPLFLPGGTYRVGLSVERTVDGSPEQERATLVTPVPEATPSSLLGDVLRMQDASYTTELADALASATPGVRQATCRIDEVELALLSHFGPSTWGALGASSHNSSNYLAARQAIHELYCTDQAFDGGWFHALTLNYGRNVSTYFVSIVDEIATSAGLDRELATRLMLRTMNDHVAQQLKQCGADTNTLAKFLVTGERPQSGLESALLGVCQGIGGGGANGSASEIANGLVSGNGLGGSFRSCVNNAIAKELEDQECSDPRAWGPGVDEEVLEQCMNHTDPGTQDRCFADARRFAERSGSGGAGQQDPDGDGAPSAAADPCSGSDRLPCQLALDRLNSPAQPSAEEIRATREGGSLTGKYWSTAVGEAGTLVEIGHGVAEGLWDVTIAGIKGFVGAIITLPYAIFLSEGEQAARQGYSVVQERNLRESCAWVDNQHRKCRAIEELQQQGGGNRRCVGERLGDHVATYLVRPSGESGTGESMTLFDRLDACYCDHLGSPVFGQDCLSPDERRRQECIDPPPGDDDGPARECAFYMHSDTLSRDLLDSAICHYVRPDPDCTSVIGPDGRCLCVDDLPRADVEERIGQQICGSVYCDPLGANSAGNAIFDVRTGCCQEIPPRFPETPGQGPTCLPDSPLDDYFRAFDRDALAPATIVDVRRISSELSRESSARRDVRFYRAGYTSALGPLTSRDNYPELRDFESSSANLNLEVFRAGDTSCDGGRVQAFCTSSLVENRLLGEVDLARLPAGQFGELQIPVASSLLDECLPRDGSSARIGFAVDSCEDQGFRTALGDYVFTRNREWTEPDERSLCPLDETATQQSFVVNVSPTTTAELKIEE